jgi:hypothetical protein
MERKSRYDLLLSMLSQGGDDSNGHQAHPVAAALNELLGTSGKLRLLFENLVGKRYFIVPFWTTSTASTKPTNTPTVALHSLALRLSLSHLQVVSTLLY